MEKTKLWKIYQSIPRPPREELVNFLKNLPEDKKPTTITDLGCGGMYDTEYLLKLGYKVNAIDANINEKRQKEVLNNQTPEQKNNVSIQKQFLENLNLPKSDMLFSLYTLPFCKENKFSEMLINIVKSINPNGYFLGNFFANKNMLSNDGEKAREFSTEQISNLFDYLGFSYSLTVLDGEKTKMGVAPDKDHNLTYISVEAQAPEQLPSLDPKEIEKILGICQNEENTSEIEKDFDTKSTFTDYEDKNNLIE